APVAASEAQPQPVSHGGRPQRGSERQAAYELPAGHEMRRRVPVPADVKRHGDLLASGAIEREVLDPPDGRAGISGKCWRVEREVLREVEKPHDARDVRTERCTLPIALRGSLSILTTRLGHL